MFSNAKMEKTDLYYMKSYMSGLIKDKGTVANAAEGQQPSLREKYLKAFDVENFEIQLGRKKNQ